MYSIESMLWRNSTKTHKMQQGEKSILFLFGKVWNLSGLAFELPTRWRALCSKISEP
jgi:hypothetical protein